MTRLVGLYPRSWRDRYEVEFLGVMEARRPSIGDQLDIVRGAVDARLHPQIPAPSDPARRPRRRVMVAGLLTMVGGAGWLAWMTFTLRYFRGWGSGMPEHAELGMAISFMTFLALTSATIAIAVAFDLLMPARGMVGAILAAFGFLMAALGGGMLILFGFVGVVLLAWSLSGRVIPHWLAIAWIGATVLTFSAMVAFVAGNGRDVGLLALGIPFGIAWLVVGVVIAVGRAPVSVGTVG